MKVKGILSNGMDVVEVKFDLNELRVDQNSLFSFGLLRNLFACLWSLKLLKYRRGSPVRQQTCNTYQIYLCIDVWYKPVV